MSKKGQSSITVKGVTIPMQVTQERRNGYRIAFVKTGLSLRIPHNITETGYQEILGKTHTWLEEVYKKKPEVIRQFTPKNHKSGDVLEVSKRQYRLEITEAERQTSSAMLKHGVINLTLNKDYDPINREKAIKTLLSRVIGQDFQREITRRVMDWNDRTFRRPINSVNLKYNHSNWGSCSSNSNVNLSTRLLLTPEPIQDYVILHELAHLIEMNHSPRFWALVEQHMPDYKKRRKWLRDNQGLCDF